ncbi:MAG: SWIM zinc finger family protein, partial [Nitrosospira sp.]|nr:SWIM zinc finger family protein [Nitrosospira sp.]
MTRQTYGKTWWGEQWLKALAHIDYDNRLPRGRTYANKGAVKELGVQEGTVHAKVKGSRARPYQIALSVPSIPKKQVARLLDRIVADPVLIARMLNRDLDPAVLNLAETLGISIFPSRWTDLHMDCSCPDWAVPCKHLAAVIYLLSREIDGNPFLVFSLRGIDLVEALQARDLVIEADGSPPELMEILQTGADPAPATAQPAALEAIDFSALPELTEPLLSVLPTQPAFFSGGDFQATYKRSIVRAAKAARRALDAPPPEITESAAGPFQPDDRPRI